MDERSEMVAGYSVSRRDRDHRKSYIMRDLLFEMCFQFCSRDDFGRNGTSISPALDEMTRGLMDMLKTGKITMWIVFAFQVHFDMCDILECNVDICN